MLFSVGTRVKFLHSRDEGVVTALLENGMVMVLLDEDNIEIPAFEDDLIRADSALVPPSVKAEAVPEKQKKVLPPQVTSKNIPTKGRGIQLAFSPVEDVEGQVQHYELYVLNETPHAFLFTFALHLRDHTATPQNGKLPARAYLPVGTLLFDQLNDAPIVDLACWRITTEGTGPRLHRELRIRPKNFFKRIDTAPLLNRRVHLFQIFERVVNELSQRPEEDLRSYTKRKLPPRPADEWEDLRLRLSHDILELAEFIPECDLHIERLIDDPQQLSNAEILHRQLRHFEQYLDKAISLGVERVFIIHGLGTGRLRNAIANRLQHRPEVKDFKNEYHPRYGWGATEVIFE